MCVLVAIELIRFSCIFYVNLFDAGARSLQVETSERQTDCPHSWKGSLNSISLLLLDLRTCRLWTTHAVRLWFASFIYMFFSLNLFSAFKQIWFRSLGHNLSTDGCKLGYYAGTNHCSSSLFEVGW